MKVVAHIRLSLATGYCFIQQPSTASMHIALYLRSNRMLEDFVPAAYTSYRMVYNRCWLPIARAGVFHR